MNLFKKAFIFCFLLMVFVFSFSEAFAQSKDPFTREMPYLVRSARALGMGNAYYGLSNDKYALFYNPAGLKDVPTWYVDVIPIALGTNEHTIENFNTVLNMFTGGGFTSEQIKKLLTQISGDYIEIAPLTVFPAFTMKNLSVGLFLNADVSMLAFNTRVMPELAIHANADAGAAVGFAFQFLEDDALSLGFTVKGLYRASSTKSYTATKLAGLLNSGSNDLIKDLFTISENTGWAILGTVGILYDIPGADVVKPRVAASFNDFGYMDFGRQVPYILPTLNLSFSISPGWEFIRSYIAIEFQDAAFVAMKDKSVGKRFDIGGEVSFWNRIFLRVGLHQGYLAAGVGFDVWALRINYAYYKEELGAYAGQYGDQRHMLEVAIGF